MRLIKLILQDYKAFAGKHEVEIRPLNILIGRNNSGKSALLHAASSAEKLLVLNTSFAGQNPNIDIFHGKPYIGELKFGATWRVSLDNALLINKKIGKYNLEYMKIDPDEIINQYTVVQTLTITPPHKKSTIKSKKITIKTNKEEIELEHNSFTEVTVKKPQPSLIDTNNKPLEIFSMHVSLEIIKIEEETTKIKPQHQAKQNINIKKSALSINALDLTLKREEHPNPFIILNASTNHDWLLFEQVSDWYKENMGGWRLKKEEFDSYYAIRLVPPRGLDAYRESYTVGFEDAGTGMSAVLPMVVLSHLWRVGGAYISDELPPAIFLAEEPEHHLHPAAHGPLADLFIDLITNDSPHTVMVETHSEVFCLRAQRRVADGTIKPEDVIIHWMDDRSEPGMTRIVPIYIDEHGDTYRVDEQGQRVHFWPPGIFSEDYEEIRVIEKLRSESKS